MVSFGGIARKLFGSANDRRVRSFQPNVAAINSIEEKTKALTAGLPIPPGMKLPF